VSASRDGDVSRAFRSAIPPFLKSGAQRARVHGAHTALEKSASST
jgi:hypothetical protein